MLIFTNLACVYTAMFTSGTHLCGGNSSVHEVCTHVVGDKRNVSFVQPPGTMAT